LITLGLAAGFNQRIGIPRLEIVFFGGAAATTFAVVVDVDEVILLVLMALVVASLGVLTEGLLVAVAGVLLRTAAGSVETGAAAIDGTFLGGGSTKEVPEALLLLCFHSFGASSVLRHPPAAPVDKLVGLEG